jgi:hypothetical protein
VTDDGKRVKRKIPLQGLCKLDKEWYEKEGIASDPSTPESRPKSQKSQKTLNPDARLPQTKMIYPEGTSKNMMKPTGFESTYIEAPLRPEEAAEEEAMYDPDRLFDERIELAIQNFKEKRRMHEMYAHVFNKLMRFGGVESSPRTGQGVSNQDLEGLDKAKKAELLKTHTIPDDRADEEKWVVDFAGVAKAFL